MKLSSARLLCLILLGLFGCNRDSSTSTNSPVPTTAPAGMTKYPYLAADGGPHMLLPTEAAAAWTGASSIAAVTNPKSDYGRTCTATATTQMAVIPVGSSSAAILQNPPLSAWGKSSDGLVEIYYLESWTTTNLDALIAKASASLPTATLTDTGSTLQFKDPDAFLLYAGDTPTSTAYGVYRVTIPTGKYRILSGRYNVAGESITIYRLKPGTAPKAALSPATQPVTP